MCLCGSKGSIIVLRLVNLGRDKVEQQSYKVDMSNSKAGDTLRCCFSTTRDLLYVLLPREVTLLAFPPSPQPGMYLPQVSYPHPVIACLPSHLDLECLYRKSLALTWSSLNPT